MDASMFPVANYSAKRRAKKRGVIVRSLKEGASVSVHPDTASNSGINFRLSRNRLDLLVVK
jgi:hypothetical protein